MVWCAVELPELEMGSDKEGLVGLDMVNLKKKLLKWDLLVGAGGVGAAHQAGGKVEEEEEEEVDGEMEEHQEGAGRAHV